jgi:hypothetical protein
VRGSGRSPARASFRPKFAALQGILVKLAKMTLEFAISAIQSTDLTWLFGDFPAEN